ncbi:MAG: hypothetical protein F6K00_20880 [Leptolyngbya sp. SIOISBB]|nr:hypothetical protein [Leptolyngbya sp. SIOISBB]
MELSAWDKGEPIEQWIVEVVKQQYGIPKLITQHWLEQNDILPLLDGLDELGLPNQQKCIGEINTFLIGKARYGLVICCRREEYEAGQAKLDSLKGSVYLEPLQKEQIQTYFERLNRRHLWEQLQENSTLLELTQKPLFLSMLVVAYQGKPITNEEELFDAFIDQKLEGATGVYPPNRELNPKQTCIYLVWLAQQLERAHKTEFLIEGLQPSMLRQNRNELHLYKLLYELLYGLLGGLFGGLFGGLLGGLTGELLYGLISGLIGGLIYWLIGRLGIGLFYGPSSSIELSEKLMFSFSGASKFGLIGGPIVGLINGLIGGPIYGLLYGLIGGLFFGLIGGLSFELSGDSVVNETSFPNQGVWKTLRNSIIVILVFGLSTGLVFGLNFGLISGRDFELDIGLIFGLIGGLNFGLIFGLNFGLVSGLGAVIQHVAIRIVLTKNGHTPWNYARFLNHAVELRFMQRVGGRYRFVHDLLRKHFAAMSLD